MPDDPSTPSPTHPAIGCVILAAGGSRRLGEPKQLLTSGTCTLLEHTVRTALAVPDLWPVVVVIGAHANALRPILAPHPVLVAENAAWAEGIASSLRLGLSTVRTFSPRMGAVVFTLCDQPGLDASMLAALVAAHRRRPRALIAARYDGHAGAPALLSAAHFPALAHLTGDEGARRLIQAQPPADLELIDLPQLALDLDTPEDVARWRRQSPQP